MSKKKSHSVCKKVVSGSSPSILQRFVRFIRRMLEKSTVRDNGVYFVHNNIPSRKSAYDFPRKIGSEIPKAKKTIFQRR